MRKIIFVFVCIILLTQFISAEITIIINNPPNELYNLGDFFSIPITITSIGEVSASFRWI